MRHDVIAVALAPQQVARPFADRRRVWRPNSVVPLGVNAPEIAVARPGASHLCEIDDKRGATSLRQVRVEEEWEGSLQASLFTVGGWPMVVNRLSKAWRKLDAVFDFAVVPSLLPILAEQTQSEHLSGKPWASAIVVPA